MTRSIKRLSQGLPEFGRRRAGVLNTKTTEHGIAAKPIKEESRPKERIHDTRKLDNEGRCH